MEQSNMTPAISVVVPVYNGERYLEECVRSILAQTFTGFELLLLDDGSPDRSGEICDRLAGTDKRIRVIHKANEGINATRCRGAQEARGEWVAFCDDDDSMPADALQSLYDHAEDTDMVIGFPVVPQHKDELTLEQCRENSITGERFPPTPWAKLYRRELLTPDVFDFPREIDGEEDMIMNIRLIFRLHRAPHLVFKKVYNFRRNTSSVSHTKSASLSHEDAFDRARAASIPEKDLPGVMPFIIKSRLNGLVRVGYVDPQSVCDSEHPYLLRLRSDIRKYRYHCSAVEWLLLHLRPAAAIKGFCFMLQVCRFVKYHLGIAN